MTPEEVGAFATDAARDLLKLAAFILEEVEGEPSQSQTAVETAIRLIRSGQQRTKAAERLWQLLDNIDTLDDSCRDNDVAFRREARKQQKQRFEIAESHNGQTLTWK